MDTKDKEVTPSPPHTHHLFTLPLELRQQIYQHILTPPPTITITTSVKHDHILFSSTSTCTTTIPIRLLLLSRQLRSELLPIVYSLLTLYLSFDPKHTLSVEPRQPDLQSHIPSHVLRSVQRIVYLFPLFPKLGYGVHERPPRDPFVFTGLEGLRRFVLRKSVKVGIEVFGREKCGGVSRGVYEGMVGEERLRVWELSGLVKAEVVLGIVGRFGKGGWVGSLVEGGGEVGEECDLVVELEMMLFGGSSWRPECVDMVLVEVGVRERRVRRVRFVENPYPSAVLVGGSGRGDEVLLGGRNQFALRHVKRVTEV